MNHVKNFVIVSTQDRDAEVHKRRAGDDGIGLDIGLQIGENMRWKFVPMRK